MMVHVGDFYTTYISIHDKKKKYMWTLTRKKTTTTTPSQRLRMARDIRFSNYIVRLKAQGKAPRLSN